MGKGQVYDDPKFRYVDSHSNRQILRLTDYLGHSNHFYFTDPCWFNNNRSFIFTSQRENQGNLFRYDLDNGKIIQITDFRDRGRPGGILSTANNSIYLFQSSRLIEINLDSLEERVICEIEGKMSPAGRANPTADGKFILTQLREKQQSDKTPRISYSYSNFVENFKAKPFSQIVRINRDSGVLEVVHEDRRNMGHINTSPVIPDVLTYCHEGPWDQIEQRIWGLNIQTGETWKIRDQEDHNIAIGHEYWFADGERIGYHGRPRDGKGNHVFGFIKWDNTDHTEINFPFHSTHFHSLDETMMVGDGTAASVFSRHGTSAQPYIQLFKKEKDSYIGPRILAFHRSTFNDQYAHCHPRFTPDGKSVLYTSDLTSYSNMYLVDVGDFDELPEMS